MLILGTHLSLLMKISSSNQRLYLTLTSDLWQSNNVRTLNWFQSQVFKVWEIFKRSKELQILKLKALKKLFKTRMRREENLSKRCCHQHNWLLNLIDIIQLNSIHLSNKFSNLSPSLKPNHPRNIPHHSHNQWLLSQSTVNTSSHTLVNLVSRHITIHRWSSQANNGWQHQHNSANSMVHSQ